MELEKLSSFYRGLGDLEILLYDFEVFQKVQGIIIAEASSVWQF